MNLTPNSWGSLKEFNQCHGADGKFCGTMGATVRTHYPDQSPLALSAGMTSVPMGRMAGTVQVVFSNFPEGLDTKLFGSTSIDEVAQRLSAHMPGQPVKVRYISNEDNSLSMYFSGENVTQKRTFSITDYGVKKLDHDTWLMQPGTSNRGLAKTMLADALATYRELGYTTISVYANVDVGGYAWARYGFHPDDPQSYRQIGNQIRNLFYDYLSNRPGRPQSYFDIAKNGNRSMLISTQLSEKALNGVEKLLMRIEKGDRRAFWALADAKVMGMREDGHPKPFKIGKWLMQSSGWRGTFNMNDPVVMKRFRQYVGGR